jgi:uncharacterized YigZ family protein
MSINLVPAARFSHETWVKNSHFIASIAPVFSVEEAKAFIAEIKDSYADANHNVPAYLIGFGSTTIEHASDDGEPSGTAGRPALSVLKGSGLGDTALVITRYFGGTKLGTGGLVKAYSNSARYAIDLVPKAAKIPSHRLGLSCHYSVYEQMIHLIKLHSGFALDAEFTDQVSIKLSLPTIEYAGFQKAALDLTQGTVEIKLLEENLTALKPIRS